MAVISEIPEDLVERIEAFEKETGVDLIDVNAIIDSRNIVDHETGDYNPEYVREAVEGLTSSDTIKKFETVKQELGLSNNQMIKIMEGAGDQATELLDYTIEAISFMKDTLYAIPGNLIDAVEDKKQFAKQVTSEVKEENRASSPEYDAIYETIDEVFERNKKPEFNVIDAAEYMGEDEELSIDEAIGRHSSFVERLKEERKNNAAKVTDLPDH